MWWEYAGWVRGMTMGTSDWASVNMVMDIQFPKKAGNLLIILVSISF
jgi:hypothetical protein